MKKSLFSWFMFLLFLQSGMEMFAQTNRNITLIGRIFDEQHHGLKDASVVDSLAKKGTTTNRNGIFYLTLPLQSINLRVDYLGYKTFREYIPIDSIKLLNSDTVSFSIILELETKQLKEISVTAEKTKLAYNKPGVLILDFDFYEKYLVLLIYENQKYKLKLTDDSSNIVSELILKRSANKLFRDCYDNIHVLGDDSTHQISFEKIKISLLEGHSIEKFNEYVFPLVASTKDNLFYKTYGLYNQSINYFYFNENNKKRMFLKEVRNMEAENFVAKDRKRAGIFRAKMAGYDGVEFSHYQPNFYRNINLNRSGAFMASGTQQAFYEIILTIPIYDPLVKIGNELFLFDHVDDTAFVYNQSGKLIRYFSINYHHQKGWKNELIFDNSKTEVYAKYLLDGKVYLVQINLSDGAKLNKYELELAFPKSIKIKDGYAYYLYKDRFEEMPITNLYKQKIK